MHGTPRGRSRRLRLIGIVIGLALGLAALVAAAATQTGSAAAGKAARSSARRSPSTRRSRCATCRRPARRRRQEPAARGERHHGRRTAATPLVEGDGSAAAELSTRPQAQRRPSRDGRDRRPDRELRGPQQPGQLQRLRLPRQPAGPGRRRGPEPLRRDDQPRLRRLLEDGNAARSARSTLGSLWAGLPDRGLHRPVGRPDRRLRPVRRPLAPDPVHDCRRTRTVLQLRRDLDRPATRPARTTATRSSRSRTPLAGLLPRLPEVRRLDGLVRHHDPRLRDRRSSTASASTRSRRTR